VTFHTFLTTAGCAAAATVLVDAMHSSQPADAGVPGLRRLACL